MIHEYQQGRRGRKLLFLHLANGFLLSLLVFLILEVTSGNNSSYYKVKLAGRGGATGKKVCFKEVMALCEKKAEHIAYLKVFEAFTITVKLTDMTNLHQLIFWNPAHVIVVL